MGKVSIDYITIMCEVILICLSLFRANNVTDLLDHFPRRNKVVERLRKSILKKEKGISKKEEELDCPVCLETARVPIYMCSEQHIICSCSANKVSNCPQCREELARPLKRHRYAEREVEELASLREELDELNEELAEVQGEEARGL